jgi:hypothetical protein
MDIGEFATTLDPSGQGAAPEQIAAFEAMIGAALPGDYKQFLGMCRGVCPIPCISFPFGKYREPILSMGGLVVQDKQSCSILKQFSKPSWHPLPEHLIWIGNDTSGNPITLSLRPDRFGEIFLIDHELLSFNDEKQEAIEDAEAYGLADSLASSFTDFVGQLVVGEWKYR